MMHEKFKRMASLMLTAAMLVSNAGGGNKCTRRGNADRG